MNLEAWRPVGKSPNYSEFDKKFLEFVRVELGDDPKKQTKVFSTSVLLDVQSLIWCGVCGVLIQPRQKELGLEDLSEYPAWRLHPNRFFFYDCPICSSLSFDRCRTNNGTLLHIF